MEVTREQIAHGVIKYLKQDMIPHIADRTVKVAVGMMIKALELDPTMIDGVINNWFVSAFAKTTNGYDLAVLGDALSAAITEYGENGRIHLTLSSGGNMILRLLMPNDIELAFSASDVKRLMDYIEGRA